jgi:hypothetical protein
MCDGGDSKESESSGVEVVCVRTFVVPHLVCDFRI